MSAAVNDDELMKRYVTIMDAATQGRTLFRQRLLDAGTATASVARLLDTLPASPPLAIDRRRTPANLRAPRPERPAVQLIQLGNDAAEEHWYEVAYSLLSQVIHATPLGEMHLQARRHGDVRKLSHEMTALSADVACLSTATLVGPLAGLLAQLYGIGDVSAWSGELYRAAGEVHSVARLVHFLD
ncbi:hypothetical protein [Modestobacter sp. VKM Ac-2977]|uniref:hypothetical protein n=1 Tax=Modestobacter sp. VKM Ac-2977 TaxID=3004131 RepID=UPI0022AA7E35|nr:hypothetical protein [Modestobacter sp. VKM Ac-2977]